MSGGKGKRNEATSYEDDVEENDYKQLILRPWPATEVPRSNMTSQKFQLAKDLLNSVLRVDARSKTFYHSVVKSIPKYEDVIPNPMCLEEIQKKLHGGMYSTVEIFLRDLRRVFANCVRYWGPMGSQPLVTEALQRLKHCENAIKPKLSNWRLCGSWAKCMRVLSGLLAKGEKVTYIFQRPVTFYYNGAIPEDYIPTVLYMSDIGSLTSSLLEGDIASPEGFIRECVRIFRNCQMYTEHDDYRKCGAIMLKELESLVAVEIPKCLSEVKDDRWNKQRKKQKLKAEDPATTTNIKDSSNGIRQQIVCDSLPATDVKVASLLDPDQLRSIDVPLNMTASQRRSGSRSNNQLEAMKKELGTSTTKTFVSQVREACGCVFDKLRNEAIVVNEHRYSTDLFFTPVDESVVSDYRQYVSSPIDLGRAEALLNEGKLDSVVRLFKTIRKVFMNAIEYNAPGKGKFGSATIYDLGVYLLPEVQKQQEKTLQRIRDLYALVVLERQNAGGGGEGVGSPATPERTTDYVLCIPEKCPNVSVELLDSLKLKERLEGLLEVKHDRKRSSSYGEGGAAATTSPPKPTTTKPSRTPVDEGRKNECRNSKLNNSSVDTSESRRNSMNNSALTRKLFIKRITLKLSTPAPHADELSSTSIVAETPVQKHLPTEVSRTGISNASGVHLGTVSADPSILIAPTRPSHLPNSRSWVATHLFEPVKSLSVQLEKWEVNCDKVLKRLMRHEFVDPKKSTLYLHVPACSVLPSVDSYLDIIENPMDLGSIQKALEDREIPDAQSFVDLTLLVFNNCLKFYNGSDNPNDIHLVESCSFLGRIFSWMCLESLELRNDEPSDRCTEGKKFLFEAGSHIPPCPLTTAFCQQQRLSRLKELEELHMPRDGDKEAFQLIKKLCAYQNLKYMKWFSDPVDVALIPDYQEHISNPIDISTIENKLATHEYLKYGEIVSDLRRIFTNAIRYNERLRAVDKNSNLICQAVEQMQPVLERLLSERFSVDVLERVGREQVLNNKRKHLEEENRRILEARRKVVAEDPHKYLSVHLPQEEESIGEVSSLKSPSNAIQLMKRRDLGRRKVQRTRELELMEQQRADRLRCVVTKNMRRLCCEHPSMCHVEGRPYQSSTSVEDVSLSSSKSGLKKKTSNENMEDSTARARNDTDQQLSLCSIVNGEKKWRPTKLREKKQNVSLLSSVLYDFESMNDDAAEEVVDTKQDQLSLQHTPTPVATVKAVVAAQDAIEEVVPSLCNGTIRRQSIHIESLDENETVFEEIRFFFPRRPKRHAAFASVKLVQDGILLTPCREVQVLLHSGPNHSVRFFGDDEQWKDMETLQRIQSRMNSLRTVGPEEDCAFLYHPHPMTATTSKGDDVRVSAVLQASDLGDETYLPVFGGCLVWTAVPSLGPPNHDEFCVLSRNGAIGNARMCSKFAVAHATTPRTD